MVKASQAMPPGQRGLLEVAGNIFSGLNYEGRAALGISLLVTETRFLKIFSEEDVNGF